MSSPESTARARTSSLPVSTSLPVTDHVPASRQSSLSSDDSDFPDYDEWDFRARGQGPSSMSPNAPSITIAAAAGDMRRTQSASASVPTIIGHKDLEEKIRERSLLSSPTLKSREASPAPSTTLDTSWWGPPPEKPSSPLARTGQPKRKHTIPASEVEGYESTKKRVAFAVRSCLGNVADITHELLTIGVDLLELAPVPGLAPAAKTLLNIWDAVDGVDVNFHRCLRLTERCAEILISIRQEIHAAGDTVAQELHAPIVKLESTFDNVLDLMNKQSRRPFLKRFLKREEISSDISECDGQLTDAVSLFGLSIQIRILKQVQQTELQRQKDTQAILNTFVADAIAGQTEGRLSPISLDDDDDDTMVPEERIETTSFITTRNALGLADSANQSQDSFTDPLSTICQLKKGQDSVDQTNDYAALRMLMHKATQAGNDAEMMEILQVRHEQMPDAIKTLQRALENVVDRNRKQTPTDTIPPGVVIGKVKRRISVKDVSGQGLQRSTTVVSIESTSSTQSSSESGSGNDGSWRTRDTLEEEFIESGISALVRMSQGKNTNLPSWTITKYEIDREKKIGVGGFSEVYRGTWKGQIVAIKVLKLETDKKLFIREVEIWKTLHHTHVLELYGASSGSERPWFFVSPYQKHGSLVDYLKKVARGIQGPNNEVSANYFRIDRTPKKTSTIPMPFRHSPRLSPPMTDSVLGLPGTSPPKSPLKDTFKVRREWDLFRFIHEIAKGMEYLHQRGVLHGDLKAANVLIDDDYRCVITDFGQSEMKSTALRLTGMQPQRGTFRWQAPELLEGEGELTRETDVYAFAITCVEIITLGKLPWSSLFADEAIRSMILNKDSRPPISSDSRFNTPAIQALLRLCWHRNPSQRPSFPAIARDLKVLRKNFGQEDLDRTPTEALVPLPEEDSAIIGSPTPDLGHIPLPPFSPGQSAAAQFPDWETGPIHREETVPSETIKWPEPAFWTEGGYAPISQARPEPGAGYGEIIDRDFGGKKKMDAKAAESLHELKYRRNLIHDFHPTLVLPLWHPSEVLLGAVGYLSKPKGEFITLFNAMAPDNADHPSMKDLPSIEGYGKINDKSVRHNTRTLAQKGWDSLAGMLKVTTRSKEGRKLEVSKRYSFPLRNGHAAVHLCTRGSEYRYMDKVTPAKKWFKANIQNIMNAYPQIQREDFCLVFGLVRTETYSMFVSHSHPDGNVHFNVYKSPLTGQPWGTWTTDTTVDQKEQGTSNDSEEGDDTPPRLEASKVSKTGGRSHTILISRLRFRPDEDEPTIQL
ncbi:TKL/TKL-ccin protein kinase [Coprinopsis marcescibilis]|uniref:TKL/TKL-ccin protein kinase n=1 Tax=Coprinopsis marcescibilis TaxID=230819 RepID=A0A5C3KHQ3_COPMA|nr:TKL/TKL-ccin protein kinase [Coprinopsis marcescibilis]